MGLPDVSCVRNGQLVCADDLCHGVDRTVCGAEEGLDFCGGDLCPGCPFCDGGRR